MKFKLKQPTKYMHQSLEHQDQDQVPQSFQEKTKKKQQTSYKKKKIIVKKNEPSALRLNKINQTFQNIYYNSNHLFQDLNVNLDFLNDLSQITEKHKCLCDKNVKFYCLKCNQKVCSQKFPEVQIPFDISIIHHQSQKINKSSALPLTFLTKQVNFYFFSSLQEGRNIKLWQQLPKPSKNTYILFPHKQSKLIEQVESQSTERQYAIKNLIILDCTWFQTDQLLQILKQKGYKQYIRIEGYKSIYWRYNHHNDEALSSAQAIAFFMRQYQKAKLRQQQNSQTQIVCQKQSQKKQRKLNQKQQLNQKLNKDQNGGIICKSQSNNQIRIKKYDNLLFLYCLSLKMILKQEQKRSQTIKSQKQENEPIDYKQN